MDDDIFQKHAKRNLLMVRQDNYYKNLYDFFAWLNGTKNGFNIQRASTFLQRKSCLR